MTDYPRLDELRGAALAVDKAVVDHLLDCWLDAYASAWPHHQMVEVTLDSFSYLFDPAVGRLISAFGYSSGKNTEARDKSRMRGHPLGDGPLYHRGHAIPHTLGGGYDINLVPQLGAVNIGPFRELEKRAVATPGAFYFSHWSYRSVDGQTPSGVQQGLLIPGHATQIRQHRN